MAPGEKCVNEALVQYLETVVEDPKTEPSMRSSLAKAVKSLAACQTLLHTAADAQSLLYVGPWTARKINAFFTTHPPLQQLHAQRVVHPDLLAEARKNGIGVHELRRSIIDGDGDGDGERAAAAITRPQRARGRRNAPPGRVSLNPLTPLTDTLNQEPEPALDSYSGGSVKGGRASVRRRKRTAERNEDHQTPPAQSKRPRAYVPRAGSAGFAIILALGLQERRDSTAVPIKLTKNELVEKAQPYANDPIVSVSHGANQNARNFYDGWSSVNKGLIEKHQLLDTDNKRPKRFWLTQKGRDMVDSLDKKYQNLQKRKVMHFEPPALARTSDQQGSDSDESVGQTIKCHPKSPAQPQSTLPGEGDCNLAMQPSSADSREDRDFEVALRLTREGYDQAKVLDAIELATQGSSLHTINELRTEVLQILQPDLKRSQPVRMDGELTSMKSRLIQQGGFSENTVSAALSSARRENVDVEIFNHALDQLDDNEINSAGKEKITGSRSFSGAKRSLLSHGQVSSEISKANGRPRGCITTTQLTAQKRRHGDLNGDPDVKQLAVGCPTTPFAHPRSELDESHAKTVMQSYDQNRTARQLATKPLILSAGANDISSTRTCQILLLIDNREIYGSGRADMAARLLSLAASEMSVEIKLLEVGDALFVARPLGAEDDTRDVVLDFLIERKTASDLASSLSDGRYQKQKYFMKHSDIPNLIYLLEGRADQQGQTPVATINSCLDKTAVSDGFIVHRAKNADETIAFFQSMYKTLDSRFGCQAWSVVSKSRSNFSQWSQRQLDLRKGQTLGDIFKFQLTQIPGVSEVRANAIVCYGGIRSISRLRELYAACADETEKESLVQRLCVAGGSKKIDKATSQTLYRLFNWSNYEGSDGMVD